MINLNTTFCIIQYYRLNIRNLLDFISVEIKALIPVFNFRLERYAINP